MSRSCPSIHNGSTSSASRRVEARSSMASRPVNRPVPPVGAALFFASEAAAVFLVDSLVLVAWSGCALDLTRE